MSDGAGGLLSQRTPILGLRLWEIIALALGGFTVLILFLLSLRLNALARRKSKSKKQLLPCTTSMIPEVSKEIKEDVPTISCVNDVVEKGHVLSAVDISDDEKEVVTFAYGVDITQLTPNFHNVRSKNTHDAEKDLQISSFMYRAGSGTRHNLAYAAHERINARVEYSSTAEDSRTYSAGNCNILTAKLQGAAGKLSERTTVINGSGSTRSSTASAAVVVEQLKWWGWGEWYSVDELEKATSGFAETNIIGKGGYGVVYRGLLPDASVVAVKHLLNTSRDQAEKEFKVEVKAIGRARHKNLVGLVGYCAEGFHRMLVYEYVDNGNLEQWLHGSMGASEPIPWDTRMKILLGTAKGLAYLHEDLEPKVVHRDVKASNILLDSSWNAKVSDFGLAKLLGAGMSHVTTRVMGTFGYVAPEYASTGLLKESSDVYSFGVLMMEVITGRDPVDYSRPAGEVNLVEWMKRMVGSRRWDEVVDPRLAQKPSGRALKRALLVALRCVDPDALHRPRMAHIVYMLEADDLAFHHVCRNSRHREDGAK